MSSRRLVGRVAMVAGLLLASTCLNSGAVPRASADGYQRISGEGSSWAANFIDAMRVNVAQFGMTVDFNPSGSTSGRKNFLNGTVDFAASDIPFQFHPEDGSAPENPAPGSYAYMPMVAGGTALMYNLKVNGKRVTNLRLSGENVAKIFTGKITSWDDPAIAADNPGLMLPARAVVPVVRADGSGSTAQFSLWMISRFPDIWNDYCNRSGRAPACGETSFYPTIQGMISQQGDLGVSGYVSQSFAEGAIGYVNYSYALNTEFPVAKVLNAAGYYTEPTPQNVAVSLLQAKINTDDSNPAVYLTQNLDGVFADTDPRNYQLSSYSYLILPTTVAGQFNADKGKTLGAFAYRAMCEGQQQSATLGYSPMPINLVQASIDQISKIPGVVLEDVDITKCNNPTFSADGSNLLAKTAPQPQACDKQGPLQCTNGTGGLSNVPTAVSAAASGATPAAGGGTPAPSVGGNAAAGGGTPVPSGGGNAAAGGGTTAAAGGGTPAASGGGTPAAAGASTPAAGSGATPAAGGGAPSSGSDTPAAVGGTPTVDGSSVAGGGTVTGDPSLIGDASVAGGATNGLTCDADTGICAAGATAGPPTAVQSAVSPVVGGITTTTLSRNAASGSSVPLVIVIILLVVGLVLAPALAWRHFANAVPA